MECTLIQVKSYSEGRQSNENAHPERQRKRSPKIPVGLRCALNSLWKQIP